jgi:3-methyladenine DNA glycosylase/8-oxoguanine DNA glycosylase
VSESKSRRVVAGVPRPTTWSMAYKPPYNWDAVLSFFRAHQIPHLEAVDERSYERVVKTTEGTGLFRVSRHRTNPSLTVKLWNGSREDAQIIKGAVWRMFDLGADTDAIGKAMSEDPCLSALWQRYPGRRVARTWNGFESLLTTILGQLVSVAYGRILANQLMEAAGVRARHPITGEPILLFPTARAVLKADLRSIRTSEARRSAIRSVAELVANETLMWENPPPHAELRKLLLSVRGIGAWTSEYIAMRGFHDDDAFPRTDYALKQELKRLSEVDANRVRPWRAYAAVLLWNSFAANADDEDELRRCDVANN